MFSYDKPVVLGKDLRKALRPRPRRPAITLIVSEVLGWLWRTLVVLRNDPFTPKIRKHPKEHLLGVHQVVESETAGLAGIGDDIVIRSEYAVRVAPGCDLFETESLQSVVFDDFLPDRPLLRHRPSKVDGSWRSQLHPEETSEFGPQILPPDQIAVGDVE